MSWLLNRWVAFPLVWVFCLPGGAVLVEIFRGALAAAFPGPFSLGPQIPLPIEAALVGVAAIVLALGVSATRMLARSLGWAIAVMGHAALANALSPGRDADRQLIWLGAGAVLGAGMGLLVGSSRERVRGRSETPETPGSALEPAASAASCRRIPRGRGALVAGLLVLAMLAAMAARYALRAAAQARISEAVVLLEGRTVYDHPGTPTLLFKWLDLVPRNDECFCLSSVELGAGAENDDLAELAAMGLGSLPDLCELRLRRSRVTDDGLVALASLPNLKRISLGRATTDAGMSHLDGFASLEFLDLTSTRVTGAGLRSACHLPALASLRLQRTRITSDDLAQLKAFPQLICLDLSDTPITDAGLVHLKELPNLSSLALVGTPITDAGLKHLAEVPRLRWLFLTGTKVTPEGVDQFRRARPYVWTE